MAAEQARTEWVQGGHEAVDPVGVETPGPEFVPDPAAQIEPAGIAGPGRTRAVNQAIIDHVQPDDEAVARPEAALEQGLENPAHAPGEDFDRRRPAEDRRERSSGRDPAQDEARPVPVEAPGEDLRHLDPTGEEVMAVIDLPEVGEGVEQELQSAGRGRRDRGGEPGGVRIGGEPEAGEFLRAGAAHEDPIGEQAPVGSGRRRARHAGARIAAAPFEVPAQVAESGQELGAEDRLQATQEGQSTPARQQDGGQVAVQTRQHGRRGLGRRLGIESMQVDQGQDRLEGRPRDEDVPGHEIGETESGARETDDDLRERGRQGGDLGRAGRAGQVFVQIPSRRRGAEQEGEVLAQTAEALAPGEDLGPAQAEFLDPGDVLGLAPRRRAAPVPEEFAEGRPAATPGLFQEENLTAVLEFADQAMAAGDQDLARRAGRDRGQAVHPEPVEDVAAARARGRAARARKREGDDLVTVLHRESTDDSASGPSFDSAPGHLIMPARSVLDRARAAVPRSPATTCERPGMSRTGPTDIKRMYALVDLVVDTHERGYFIADPSPAAIRWNEGDEPLLGDPDLEKRSHTALPHLALWQLWSLMFGFSPLRKLQAGRAYLRRRRLETDLELALRQHADMELARCFHKNRDFQTVQAGPLVWHVRRALLRDAHRVVLADPDAQLRAPHDLIKDSRGSTVAAVPGDGILKRFNVKKYRNLVKHQFAPSRARKAFQRAYHLEMIGVRTPRVIAYADRKVMGLATSSYLLMERLPDVAVGAEAIRGWSATDRHLTRLVLGDAGRMIGLLHGAGFSNRDLKASNLLVTGGGEIWLVDLDGIRHMERVNEEVRIKNLRRIVRDLPQYGSLGLRDQLAFLRAYCRSVRSGRAADLHRRLAGEDWP